MSYCVEEGKDQIIFATKEDLDQPSKAIINLEEDEDDHQPGLILPNGDINWDCPCLGGMASGPCGVEFREAFSCFHYSKAEPKGSDCYEAFVTMQTCMSQFPQLYPPSKSESEEVAQLSEIGDDEEEKRELVSVVSSGKESVLQTSSEKS